MAEKVEQKVENYSKDILTDGELPENIKLSEATLNKFAEINGAIDSLTEANLEEKVEKEEKLLSTEEIRAKDETLNEDGTIKADFLPDEKPEEKKELDEKVKKPDKPTDSDKKLSLPNRLVQAARRNHLTDEDVLKLGDRAETVLSAMADNLDKVSAELGELGRLRKEAIKKEPEKKEEKIEGLDETDPMVQLINKGFAAVHQRIDLVEQQRTTTKIIEVDAIVDKFFDGKKEFPQLGDSTKGLSQFQFGIRKQIFDVADNIFTGSAAKGQPITLNESLELAFSLYEKENGNVVKQVKDDLINKVKQRESQFTSPPSQRKTQEALKAPVEAAKDKVRKFWAKRGVNADEEI